MMTVEASQQESSTPTAVVADLRGMLSAEAIVRANESMARRTTLRVGGTADVWIEPATESDLGLALSLAHRRRLPVLVVGRGSNLVVRDGGIRGIVLSLGQPHFCRVEVSGQRIRCGAGVRLKAIAIAARDHSLSGFEFLEGIPGNLGGALRMNAGAHGGATFDRVVEVRVLDREGNPQVMAGGDLHAGYRSCPALRTRVAVEALLEGQADDKAAIAERMSEMNQRRWSSQPAAPSAGCMFKNPAAAPAGRLVDELGLKGMRIGGASVSLEHGNFLVTDGKASAADVLQLIERIRAEVKQRTGIELESEVQVVGEEVAP